MHNPDDQIGSCVNFLMVDFAFQPSSQAKLHTGVRAGDLGE